MTCASIRSERRGRQFELGGVVQEEEEEEEEGPWAWALEGKDEDDG